MTTLLTIGTFDPPHVGHARLFRRCERHADEVIVGVNSDEFVLQYRKSPPMYSVEERRHLIETLGYQTHRNDTAGRDLIERIGPDIIAIGSDWMRKDYMAQIDMTPDDFDKWEISLLYLPYTKGVTSSDMKARL